MQVKTDVATTTVESKKTLALNTTSHLSSLSGGSVTLKNENNSNYDMLKVQNSKGAICMGSNTHYFILTLTNPIAEGDEISFTSTGSQYICFTKTESRSDTYKVSPNGTNKLTIAKNNPLIGESTIYVWRGGGNTYVNSLTITSGSDTQAPTLSSSVPANSATGVAVSGNIVLTFSENVTVNDASKFSLSGGEGSLTTASISVSGAAVTIPYTGLENNKTYTFSAAAGAVKDAANNTSAALDDILFTTVAAVTPVCPSGISISGTAAYTEGETIELTAALETGNGDITYTWYKGSIEVGNEVGTNSNELTIASCTTSDESNYYCVASKDACSNATSTAYAVTVAALPEYTITYNANGGTGTMTATTGYGVVNLRANSYTKSGYVFAGWATSLGNANAGTIAYADGAEYNLTADADLYAVWYTVLYSFTAKDVASSAAMAVDEVVDASTGGTMTVLTTPASYETYGVLLGYSDPNKGSYQVTMSQNMSAGAKIIGTLYMTGSNNNRGVNVVNSAGTQKAQWKFTADGNAHKFTYNVIADDGFAGNNIIKFTRINNVAIQSIIVAQFVAPAIDYTVTINPNGGSYAETPEGWTYNAGVYTKTVSNGTSFSAPAGLTKGTDELSWKDGEDHDISFPKTISGDITFVAQWAPKFTVTYSLNGPSGDAPEQAAVTAGTEITLADAPSWAGHAFDGWLCSADAGVKDAASVYTMTAANTTFTAQWHEVDCKIYSLTGGIGSAEIVADESNAEVNATSLVLKGSNAVIKLTPATGETFKAGDVVTISGTVGKTTKNFGVKISASNNKGSGLGTASASGTANPMTASVTLEGDADYLYICRADGTTQTLLTFEVHRSCAEGEAAGLSYATAEVNKYTTDAAFTNPLTNANGLTVVYGTSDATVATVNANGAVTIVGAGNATITAYTAVQTKAGTLYAAGTASYTLTVATPPTYAVTYAKGDVGADGTMTDPNSPYVEGAEVTLLANTFTAPSGKEFDEWVVTKTVGGEAVAVSEGKFTMPGGAVTVTAKWKVLAAKYTVHYMDADGTTPLAADELVVVSQKPAGLAEDPTKPLYTFAAWQLSGVDIALDADSWASVLANAEVTLTARWAKTYATSVDFVQKITEDGTSGWKAYLEANNYYIASETEVSFDNANAFDTGLKMKNNTSNTLSFRAAPGKVIDLTVGKINGMTIAINGGAASALTSGTDATHLGVSHYYAAGEQEVVLAETVTGYNIIRQITIRDPYQVSFDENGGDPVAAQYATPSVTLPNATNGTQNFAGWYTSGDEYVGMNGDSYTPTANITLVAHWEALSTVNTLSDLKVDGTTVDGFDADTHTYYIVLPYGSDVNNLPKITSATATNANANVTIYPAAGPQWTDDFGGCYRQSANVTPQDPTAAVGYNDIRITIAPKDGICLIWGNVTDNAMTRDADKSKYNGTLVNDRVYGNAATYAGKTGPKFQKPGYLSLALEGQSFKAGDVVEAFVTQVNGADKLRIFNANEALDGNVIAEGTIALGASRVALPVDAGTIYLRRGNDEAGESYKDWNPCVAYVAVYRISNPILNNVTVAGVEGTPDNTNHVAIEVPFTTADDALDAIAYDWISNSDAWTAAHAPAVANTWAWGVENTVTLTDKDGDASVYYVTISKAVPSSDATLATLTYGTPATAIALADGVFEYNVELPYGTSAVPTLAATAHHAGANVTDIDDAAAFVNRHATSTVTVKAEDNITTQLYTVNFTGSRFESKVVWDGSTMSALSDITAAATAAGVAVTTTGISVTSFSAKTCEENGKSYTRALDFGGKTQSTRNFGIVIPAGKVAKVSVVYRAKSTGRSIMIATALSDAVNESTITSKEAVDGSNLHIMTADMFGGGTLYINTTDGFHVHEISLQLADGHARSAMLGAGVYGTVCVPNNVAVEDIQGVTVYELMGREQQYGKLAFDEIISGELEAGVPYLFQAHGNHMALLYGTTHVDDPVDKDNGMYGTFEDVTFYAGSADDIYFFRDHALWSAKETGVKILANRAYVKLSEIDYLTNPNPAPGRRRITMAINGKDTATDFENLDAADQPVKLMINGQIFILRGEKLYDATGRLVK